MTNSEARALLRSFPWAPVVISLALLVATPRVFFRPTDPLIYDLLAAGGMVFAIMLAWVSIAAWLRGDPYEN